MNKEKATFARPHRRARPNQVMDPTTRHRHELRLAGVGNGPPKPVRRRRTDRKEIGRHGLATQVMHHAPLSLTAESMPTSRSVVAT
jgi:hypothetical protein